MIPRNELSPTCMATVSPRCWSSRVMSRRSRCRAHWRAAAWAYSSSSARRSSRAAPAASSSSGSPASSSKDSPGVMRALRGTVLRHRTPGGRRCFVCSSVLLDGLDLELEADLLAHQDTAALERGVPGEAEVLAVDLGAGREAGPAAAPRVGRPTVVLDVESDRPGDAVDGQVAGEREVTGRAPLDPVAPELDLRVALDVEEVGRAQVLIPLRVAALDAGGVDRDLRPRAQRVVRDVDVALDAGELAPHLAHHEVPGDALHGRVDGLDLPVARLRDLDASDGAHFGLAHIVGPRVGGKSFEAATVA